MKTVVALDVGTTGVRALAIDANGHAMGSAYREIAISFPQPAWVEQDPLEIWEKSRQVLKEVADRVGVGSIVALGITNQRETTIVWDKTTGQPIHPAIVWQCRRTAAFCAENQDKAAWIRDITGLPLDPYFSASKIRWLIERYPQIAREAGTRYLFGTVDTWVLWHLCGQKNHVTEPSNASRTMLFNLKSGAYDPELAAFFEVPLALLPDVKESQSAFGEVHPNILGREIPITGILGDQQSALFAHRCWEAGTLKNTYGTGLFLVANTQKSIVKDTRLVTTIAWRRNGQIDYAIEGSIFTGGSLIQWLRDNLRFFEKAGQSEALACSVSDTGGVVLVPALTGLGAPYWDSQARGMLIGLTRGTQPAHITRAALEAIAYQTADVVDAIRDTVNPRHLLADGGATANTFLMQFQADILGIPVAAARMGEVTALGAAGIAGIGIGFWTEDQFKSMPMDYTTFHPVMDAPGRQALLSRWRNAVTRCRGWANT